MAVSGAGGWTPSVLVRIDERGYLVQIGLTHNVPPESVCGDMAYAADLLRVNPQTPVRIDVRAGNFFRLREYLAATGHAKHNDT